MKRNSILVFAMAILAMCAMASAQSLGDAARQNRNEKKPAPKKVYTNDDIQSAAPVAPATTADGVSDKPAGGGTAKTAEKKDDKKDEKNAAGKADEWKKKVDGQKQAIADDERELNLMEREHQIRVSTYYADAGNQLRDSKKWFEDEKKYQDDHAAKQKAVADAKQKLDDMKDDARKAGVPAGQLD
jgi:hypothetical protein